MKIQKIYKTITNEHDPENLGQKARTDQESGSNESPKK